MTMFTIGIDGSQQKAARQENHGKVLTLEENKSIRVVPLVYLNGSDLPQEIIELQKTDGKKFIEEAIKRTVFGFTNAQMWLDPEKVKKHNESLPEGSEKVRSVYTFQTAFGSTKEAATYADTDPVAWLVSNSEIFENSPFYSAGKFGNNAVTPKEKNYIIVYVPDYDAEMLLEVSRNQLLYIKNGLEMGGNLSRFYRNVFDLKKTKPDGKTNQYMFVRVGEVSDEDDIPMLTSLDLESLDVLGIAYDDIEKRKHILEMIGVSDKFPKGVNWNK